MPRRTWRPPTAEVIQGHLEHYPCPSSCPVRPRMEQLFGVLTYDITGESRTSGEEVPLDERMVNGPMMRRLIADFMERTGGLMREGFPHHPTLAAEYSASPATFMALAMGALTDFCFNLEYIRRLVGENRWVVCLRGDAMHFYPYLGVCPRCILDADRPQEAALPRPPNMPASKRYFGNKIEAHHVGRIGERVIVFLLDLLGKASDPNAVTGLVTDDQHDLDALFLVSDIGILAQIKASPLTLLPGAHRIEIRPPEAAHHTWTSIDPQTSEIGLFLARHARYIPLGPDQGDDWPYEPLLAALDEDLVGAILENWIAIYRSFEIPKREREGEDVKRAWLTSGWGDPVDDNKTKPGLARSDNMMKGTYACVKYGAYYVQPCERQSLRTALVANIDPAHQFEEYLEALQDIRWGHEGEFVENEGIAQIPGQRLTYLFDAVFTFNRQIVNDDEVAASWNLEQFAQQLASGELSDLLQEWRDA